MSTVINISTITIITILINSPATQAVEKEAKFPARRAKGACLMTSRMRWGASDTNAPIVMPMQPRLLSPHNM